MTFIDNKANRLTDVGVTETSVDRSAPSSHTVQIKVTGTTLPTAMTAALEGSIDEGETYAIMASHPFDETEIATGIALFHVVNMGVTHSRVRIISQTGGVGLSIEIHLRDTL